MKNSYTIGKIEDFDPFIEQLLKPKKPILLCLNGDLGAGKTTFVKYLGSKLGIKENINSPSFIIHNEYSNKEFTLHHLDLYRLEEAFEFKELKLQSLMKPENIIAIEWAEKFAEEIDNLIIENEVTVIELQFSYLDENKRLVEMKSIK
jgi:tRNA threonylcarbamoyladenosine biosynthesis protein TsaE